MKSFKQYAIDIQKSKQTRYIKIYFSGYHNPKNVKLSSRLAPDFSELVICIAVFHLVVKFCLEKNVYYLISSKP